MSKKNSHMRAVRELLKEVIEDEKAMRMKRYIQHGKINTYDHCLRVCLLSYRLNRLFKIGADEKSLVTGAFLHDYFLYDWHKKKIKISSIGEFFKLHGFTHPEIAARNAKRDFGIGKKEENIIKSHMWPLTITKFPKSKEAAIVCIADKLTSAAETIFRFKIS